MTTDWKSERVAAAFEAYDDLPERVLGYPFVFRALRLGEPDVRCVLDHGCGPGKVAQRVARRYGTRVLAVDSSPAMLAIASRERAEPLVDYRLVADERLPFPDGGVDAAMSCYVLINIASLDRIRAAVAEVHRTLRPGGRYAVLDTNPDSTGIEFRTFRSGEPGRRYAAGEARRVVLRGQGGTIIELTDHHWPKGAYRELLEGAGFRNVRMEEPVVAHAAARGEAPPEAAGWMNEATQPPFLIVVGEK